jgi:cobyrinic acid a,c-diamide synthase
MASLEIRNANPTRSLPRLLIAGMSGGSGKTLVSLGLALLARRAGFEVRAFKKGPDYIDAAWLAWASSHPARNLDTYLMGPALVRSSFARHATQDGVNLIEGNRGLFDSLDAAGLHSSAALSQCLAAPVVLVINAAKVTRTAAAFVLGCQKFDPQVAIRGVVLNNVNGTRHEKMLRAAIESACSVPVLGAVPRALANPLPERHLGLLPPQEHPGMARIEQELLNLMGGRLDLNALLSIAQEAPRLEDISPEPPAALAAANLKIGFLKDSAFSFYYPENLEELQRPGAELIPISALGASALPEDLNALYMGGGFPETHAPALSANRSFLECIRRAALAGLPIYAECGGLMLLAQTLRWKGTSYPMAGVFPFDTEVCNTPQGHGYSMLRVDRPNPFFPDGLVLRGHEFHYSRISRKDERVDTACAVLRGAGCFQKRDFVITRNVMAGYTHLHALATREWAEGFLKAARRFAPGAAQRTISHPIGTMG